jgi:hypothetical protein
MGAGRNFELGKVAVRLLEPLGFVSMLHHEPDFLRGRKKSPQLSLGLEIFGMRSPEGGED